MADELTFTIQPDNESASLTLFRKALENIERLIREVDYVVSREKSTRRWLVGELHSSAPSITVRHVFGDETTVDAVAEGIAIITRGSTEPPRYFSEVAIQDLSKMGRLFTGPDRAKNIRLTVPEKPPVLILRDIKQKAERILAESYYNLGSVEGSLDALNVHGGYTVTVWDRVSGAPVRCHLPKNQSWLQRAKELLESRVLVRGKVHYFRNGVPRSVTDVVELVDMTPASGLPIAHFGSIPDVDAAKDPVEFLRKVRFG